MVGAPAVCDSAKLHQMTAIVDRPRREAALAVAAAWLAFMTGLLAGGEIEDAVSFALAGVIGAALVFLGFAAASRCRTLPRRPNGHHARLALLSVAVGTGLGLANLAANWVIASAHPTLRALLAQRLTKLDPLVGMVSAPIVEEVAVQALPHERDRLDRVPVHHTHSARVRDRTVRIRVGLRAAAPGPADAGRWDAGGLLSSGARGEVPRRPG